MFASVVLLAVVCAVNVAETEKMTVRVDDTIPLQLGYMVWDRECIDAIELKHGTHLEAPLKEDGEPDKHQLRLVDVVVTYKPACGHIEIRKH